MNNICFKLWRWVGRKCGWYVERSSFVGWTEPIQPGKFPEHDPEMWTETKAVEKP